jgi:Spy/CpxP family protein refolding chaperone
MSKSRCLLRHIQDWLFTADAQSTLETCESYPKHQSPEEFAAMRTMYKAMFGLSLAALFATPAFAQGGGRGFGMGGGGNYGMLIGNESVQKELKLDDQQVEKGKEFAAKAQEKMRDVREQLQGLEGDERRTKQAEITKEMNASAMKAFGEFLKPEQVARLKQISYHQRGAGVFADAEVAKKLNLTDTQKSEIHAINQESQTQMREIFQSAQDDREGAMKKIAELRKETLEKATAKLNDEQQKAWKELAGAPFEVKFVPRPQQ